MQERPCGATGGALARPGERRTENGERDARQARDGRGGGGTVEDLPCGATGGALCKRHERPTFLRQKEVRKFGGLAVWFPEGASPLTPPSFLTSAKPMGGRERSAGV